MSAETIQKTCIVCHIQKDVSLFVMKKNMCKSCRNAKLRDNYANLNTTVEDLKCNTCQIVKPINAFYKRRKICIDCDNIKRRNRYATNEEYRNRVNKASIICRKGKQPSPSIRVRRSVVSSVHRCLGSKSKRTKEYIGCSNQEYINWLSYNNNNYTIDNHGKEWHIDHVIPLSRFDIVNNENDKRIAFNWRNTMALSVQENLKKSNKIIISQIEEHLHRLQIYHQENNIELPQEYIDLFAKHLDAGKS
jgi:hypothetical protein